MALANLQATCRLIWETKSAQEWSVRKSLKSSSLWRCERVVRWCTACSTIGHGVTLETLVRASHALGLELRVSFGRRRDDGRHQDCRIARRHGNALRDDTAALAEVVLAKMSGQGCQSCPRLVRHAAISDAQAIARVHVMSWQTAYRGLVPSAFLDQLDVTTRAARWQEILTRGSSEVFVSEQADGSPAAFLSLGPSRDRDMAPSIGEISALYVHPDLVRVGHGTALLAACLRSASASGFLRLTLWVLSGNVGARAFYERCGFVADGAEKDDDRWGDFTLHEVRYGRDITPS